MACRNFNVVKDTYISHAVISICVEKLKSDKASIKKTGLNVKYILQGTN